jgi:hypothetical protein
MTKIIDFNNHLEMIAKLNHPQYSAAFVAANIRMALDNLTVQQMRCLIITDEIIAKLAQHHNSVVYHPASQSYYNDAKRYLEEWRNGERQLQFLDRPSNKARNFLSKQTPIVVPGVTPTPPAY